MFSSEFCEIFKNTFFIEPFRATASVVTTNETGAWDESSSKDVQSFANKNWFQ